MKTSALPLKKQNCNAAAFILALGIYCPMVLSGVLAARHLNTGVILRPEEPAVRIVMKTLLPPAPAARLQPEPEKQVPPPVPKTVSAAEKPPAVPPESLAPEIPKKSPPKALASAADVPAPAPSHSEKRKQTKPPVPAGRSGKPAVRKGEQPERRRNVNRSPNSTPKAEPAIETIRKPPVSEMKDSAAGSSRNLPPQGPVAPAAPHETLVYGKTGDVLMAEIVKILKTSLFYPEQARRTGRQGVVAVSFIIAKNGITRDIRVIKASTDSALLREAAVTTVKNASRFFPAPGRDIRIVVPVEFRLR